MADNELTGTGKAVATDKVTYSGDADQNVQLTRIVQVTGSEGSKTVVDLPGDATNGLDVDVTRVRPDGTNTMPSMDTNARRGYVQLADGTNVVSISAQGAIFAGGSVAHDGVDAGNPIKIGARAIAHGTNPTAVAAADRTDLLANRAGIPFFIGGHPNVVAHAHSAITTAVTDTAMGPTLSAGTKMVVTQLQVTLDNASTVFPSVRIGFGTASVPALGNAGVVAAHGGVPAGGGFSKGDGSGILAIGGDGEELRITTVGNATGNGLQVTFSYYTIES